MKQTSKAIPSNASETIFQSNGAECCQAMKMPPKASWTPSELHALDVRKHWGGKVPPDDVGKSILMSLQQLNVWEIRQG